MRTCRISRRWAWMSTIEWSSPLEHELVVGVLHMICLIFFWSFGVNMFEMSGMFSLSTVSQD